MKKIITFCASLAFLLGAVGGAGASVVTDFTFDPGGSVIPVPGSASTSIDIAVGAAPLVRSDQHLFDVAEPAQLLEGTLVLPTGWFSGTVRLFQLVGAIDAVPGAVDDIFLKLATLNVNIPAGSDSFGLVQTLSLGSPPRYYVTLDGTFAANITGNYSVQLNTLPIPLPPAVVLFLSALAGLAGISRIRRRKAAT